MIVIMFVEFFDLLWTRATPDRHIGAGEYLFYRGDAVRNLYLVKSGEIKLARHQQDGRVFDLHHAVGPAVFAEASVYTRRYHCDAVAVADCMLRSIPIRKFRTLLRSEAGLAETWESYLAHALQSARHRTEIMAMHTVADRLSAWLEANEGQLPPRGQWKSVAAQIGVSPEALYRELAKARR